jgi:hypothetical protein
MPSGNCESLDLCAPWAARENIKLKVAGGFASAVYTTIGCYRFVWRCVMAYGSKEVVSFFSFMARLKPVP